MEVGRTIADDEQCLLTKNESTVPLNKFMAEIKKNCEWN